LGSDNQTARRHPAPDDGTLRCPACAKVLEGEPNFCPACGLDLRGASGTADTAEGPLRERLIDKRYQVLEKLGEGGMGAVYKVEHVRMGKLAALKLMRPDHALDKALKARFLQEARVVAKLSHPNTVQVFDSGELDDGSLFIAMEYVPGKDLAWHLKAHGPMGEAQAAAIGVQLLASLQEAHEVGIVHRDIKPANVMLVRRRKSGDDQVKLLDFGIAKLQEAEGRKSITGEFVGTPAYMSPEQIRGDPLDARSDLYSVGCLLFELVTGRQPFDGPTPYSILTQHGEAPVPRVGEVKPDAQVSPAFEAVLVKAMAKRPEERFATAEAMRAALERLQRDLGASPMQYTPMPAELSEKMLSREDFDRFERELRFKRALAPFLAVALLLGGGGVAWRVLQEPRAVAATVAEEREPNDSPQLATRVALGATVKGAIGAAATGGDRDVYVATVAAGPHRVTLSGVEDLNLTIEVSQLQQAEKDTGGTVEKLTRRLFLDDVGLGEAERVDGLLLSAGEVYMRVEEKPYCTEPNRPSRERALVPYALRLEPMEVDGVAELEPNDTPFTAQSLPLTKSVTAWAGPQVDVDRLGPSRPDAPFSTADWFRVEARPEPVVVVVLVPPERGALLAIDGASLDGPKRIARPMTVRGSPALLELKPMPDGQRRLRVLPGDEVLPGAEYLLAAATDEDNGLSAVRDLLRRLEAAGRLESNRALLDLMRQRFASSPDLARLTAEEAAGRDR
jgi:serine/threonine-protein kinase